MPADEEKTFDKDLNFVCNILLYGDVQLIKNLPQNSDLLKCSLPVFADEFVKESSAKNEGYLFDLRLPLFFAIQSRSLKAVSFLVDKGANINYTRPWGLPGLTLATYLKLSDIVSFLLSKGADPNFVDDLGTTDRYFQSEKCPVEHKEFWNRYHRQVHQGFGQFHPPLLLAVKFPELLKILLSSTKTDPNVCFKSTSETALHSAARSCCLPALKLLLSKCDPNKLNLFGQTPLDLACETLILSEMSPDRTDALKLMINYGCKFSSPRSLFSFRANDGRRGLNRICGILWVALCVPYKYLFVNFQKMTLKQFVVEVIEHLRTEYYRLLHFEQSSSSDSDDDERKKSTIPYMGSVLRNLVHQLYCHGLLPFDAKEIRYIFEEDLLNYPDAAEIEYSFVKNLISNPLSLKCICRNKLFDNGFLYKDVGALHLPDRLVHFVMF